MLREEHPAELPVQFLVHLDLGGVVLLDGPHFLVVLEIGQSQPSEPMHKFTGLLKPREQDPLGLAASNDKLVNAVPEIPEHILVDG